ncbi:hypothetical protein PoB_000011800 [Plakobranchus ocellatus]|uniref:Uncharacterized protein n=1 Tax=Plakobranchus ocellatus TaxID=259542 RepID=A0AAV3XU44_9GAST|nr:hypothetical protein PoB_000011800 [Plakobranchus ocellatus]
MVVVVGGGGWSDSGSRFSDGGYGGDGSRVGGGNVRGSGDSNKGYSGNCIANGDGSGDGGGNADQLGRAVCMRAKTIDFAIDPTALILVTNSRAKPGLQRTCLGFAGTFVSQVRAPPTAP